MSDPLEPENEERADALAERLRGLRAAAPSAAFMARLRAAEPVKAAHASGSERPSPRHAVLSRRPWRHGIAWGAAAAAVALGVFLGKDALFGPSTQPEIGASTTAAAAQDGASGAPAADPPEASAESEGSRIYLPVEVSHRLLRIEPARSIQRPDEAPLRVVRAVWVEEITAVGAATDEALQLSRVREAYLPVTAPIFY